MSEKERTFETGPSLDTAERVLDIEYRDPYMETQVAIYEYMGEDPKRSFPIHELASVALKFGEIDPLDLTLSAAIGLQRMGLVELDKSRKYASIPTET